MRLLQKGNPPKATLIRTSNPSKSSIVRRQTLLLVSVALLGLVSPAVPYSVPERDSLVVLVLVVLEHRPSPLASFANISVPFSSDLVSSGIALSIFFPGPFTLSMLRFYASHVSTLPHSLCTSACDSGYECLI
jgi:hypothetical protein